ncbi:MAG: 2-oxo acid dehydrogenase subunit E2, partial [Planctomycetes bacterium]|nr:2-oxo acid dehydrogenase subunit E2 [Planctomycetota bacterium]
ASPRARKFAAAAEVPIALLVGSGENGRVVEADVHAYIDAIGTVSPAARTQAFQRAIDLRGLNGTGAGGQVTVADIAAKPTARNGHGGHAAKAEKPFTLPELPPLTARLEKLNPMRRAIASNMLASAQTIPAFQVEVTVDAAALIARRETAKASGEKVSFGDIVARAVALTIRKHPAFAATWTDQGIQFRDRVHIGFAVALPGGLVVPVVGDCDQRSVGDIAQVSSALVDKARTGKLAPDDYTGAVFTLSNLGSFPVDRFVAIVPPGQSGIIAIGRIRDEVVVRGGGFFAAKLMSLTLSADHRYIDGADGAAFMKDLKDILEHAEVA